MDDGAPTPDLSASAPDDAWFPAALAGSSDLVFVLRPDATVVWCNEAVRRAGYEPREIIGRSMADFLHPDDLVRAAEVMVLEASGVFSEATPITPALYRVRGKDGRWVQLEINGTSSPDDDHLLVVARVSGDLVIHDRLLESVTGGEPIANQVALVVELAVWRHPFEGYMITYLDEHDRRCWYSFNVPTELHEVDLRDEVAPWEAQVGDEPEVVAMGPAMRAAADRLGFVDCLVTRVTDPAHPEGARILIWTTRAGPTTSGHRYAVGNMRRALALVLQNQAQVSLLQRAVRIDHLTGVTSRARLMELIDAADEVPSEASRVVLYLDLDGFKAVNDSFGHPIGDEVLRGVAQRLAAALPAGAVIARVGGDEFVVLCPPTTDGPQAEDLAQRLVDLFVEPIEVRYDHGEIAAVSIGVSIGVAVGRPGQPVRSVLTTADRALFEAKRAGRGRWNRRTGDLSDHR